MKKPLSKPNIGDKIQLLVNRKTEKGILLESYDSSVVLIKLDNGYNIAFKKSEITELKVLEKRKEKTLPEKEKSMTTGQKPLIDFYITGGTISSKLDPATGAAKWLIDSQQLFDIYPDIFKTVEVKIIRPFMKASENMSFNDWATLAKKIKKSLNDPQVKGVVVTHGT